MVYRPVRGGKINAGEPGSPTNCASAAHRVEILDGDEVRTNLSKGLGFSKEDRDINIRRIGYVCHLLARNGVIAISAAISPYRDVRDEVRAPHDQRSSKCTCDARSTNWSSAT